MMAGVLLKSPIPDLTPSPPLNLVDLIGHCGPHPQEYHTAVSERLKKAVQGLTGSKYRKAFRAELAKIAKEITKKGSALNKLVTKK